MDFQMPNISGIEAIIAIRGEFNDARIVVLTTYAGPPLVVRWSGWKRRPLSHLMRRHHLSPRRTQARMVPHVPVQTERLSCTHEARRIENG